MSFYSVGEAGVQWVDALEVAGITTQLFRAGWSGEEVKEFVAFHKGSADGMKLLDHFAGGALSEMEGTPLHPIMVELTALRYALEKTRPGHGRGAYVGEVEPGLRPGGEAA